MNSRATQLGKASSDSVHAWIPDLYPGLTSTWMPGLRARARPSATICRTRRWGSVGQALREVEIRGPMKGTVKLDIPLDGEGRSRPAGKPASRTTR